MSRVLRVVVRDDTTPDEIVWAMQATRAWWAQFETDAPQFVLTTSVPLPVPSADDLREHFYDRFVGDER